MIIYINLTEFCDAIGMSQTGSIDGTVKRILAVYGLEPAAWVQGTRENGEQFVRPLFTDEQVRLLQRVITAESELSRFEQLRRAVSQMGGEGEQ